MTRNRKRKHHRHKPYTALPMKYKLKGTETHLNQTDSGNPLDGSRILGYPSSIRASALLFCFVLFQFLSAVEAVSISLKTHKSVWAPAQTEGLGISTLPIEDYLEYNSGQILSTWREGFQAWVVFEHIQGMRNPLYPRDAWSFIQHLTAGILSQAQSNYAWMSCRHFT